MTKHVLLDNNTYKDLKIINQRSAQYGDNIPSVLTFPLEFRDIQTHYPICFSHNPENGSFHAVALLGFEDGENLFLTANGWDATYIPLMIERGPFLIGLSQDQDETQSFIHFDADSPRVNTSEGESVFLEHGGNSPYLQRISQILRSIHQGQAGSKAFFAQLIEYDLIEPFVVEVTLKDGSYNKLQGFYTVNEEKLNALAVEKQAELIKSGCLPAIYMVIASLANFKILIAKKNQQLAASKI
ncbi:SapC family protein [Paraglaciecola sp.]|uniref:SapC family protein n=1 Tax=Paraglaciecola sp. TaxID=1920173 RepID=UPI0030F3A7C7